MSPRLIPWCLAATGFVAALTVFTWQGELSRPAPRLQLRAAAAHRVTPLGPDHHQFGSSQTAVASEEPEKVAQTLVLPLPPPTQPEPDPNAQPVPDDEPTVDDLPAPRSPPESAEGQ